MLIARKSSTRLQHKNLKILLHNNDFIQDTFSSNQIFSNNETINLIFCVASAYQMLKCLEICVLTKDLGSVKQKYLA